MNIAYLILAHEHPVLLERLVAALTTERSYFFIHIDKKTNDRAFAATLRRKNVFPVASRFRIFWAGSNMVKATLSLMQMATDHPVHFGYYVMLSGTDYPIKSNATIYETLQEAKYEYVRHYRIPDFEELKYDNGGLARIEQFFYQDNRFLNTRPGQLPLLNFVSRTGNFLLKKIPIKRTFPEGLIPYGGWQHMILTQACVDHVLDYMNKYPNYLRFFRFAHVSDEIAIQTIILNSPFRERVVNDNLKYINYQKSPTYVLDLEDWPEIKKSTALFARKMNPVESAQLLEAIDSIL